MTYGSLARFEEIFLPTTDMALQSEKENAFIYLMVRAIDFFVKGNYMQNRITYANIILSYFYNTQLNFYSQNI